MMRNILSVCIVFILTLSAPFVQAQSPKEIGHLEFSDTLYNFGPVKEEGGLLSHTFHFVNLGPECFVINDVDVSCGCIMPDYPEDTIDPGKGGDIILYFDPVNHPGVFDKKVSVLGNSSQQPVTLTIRGYVTPSPTPVADWQRTSAFKYGTVWLQKNYIDFGVVTTKEPVHYELSVYNDGDQPLTLDADALKLPAYMKAALLPVKVEPKQRGLLKISLNTKAMNQFGHVAEQIDVTFKTPSKKSIPVVIHAFVKEYFPSAEPVLTSPRAQVNMYELDYGMVLMDTLVSRDIILTNIGQTELAIRAIKTSCSCVESFADHMSLKPGVSTHIKIVFDTKSRSGMENKYITIITNDPSNPMITVRVKAQVVEKLPVTTTGQ